MASGGDLDEVLVIVNAAERFAREGRLSVGGEGAFAQVPVVVVLGVLGFALVAEVGRHVDGPASFGGDGVPVVLVGGVVHVVLPLELWGDGPRGGVGLSMPMAMTRAAV